MDRNLHEFLADTDDEFTVEIFASFDIHREETIAIVSSVLFKHDLRGEIEPALARTMTEHPKEFPYLEMAPVYSVKAALGIEPDLSALIQEISGKLKRSQNAFAAKLDGGELTYAKRGEYEPNFGRIAKENDEEAAELSWPIGDKLPDAQKDVGQKRVSTLLSKLKQLSKDDVAARDKRTKAVITHLGLKDVLGESRKKGYYVVESRDGKPEFVGPFAQRPDGELITTSANLEAFLEAQKG